MALSPTDISAALQSIPEKKEHVRKAFEDLEEQRATIARCSRGWKDLDSHLTEIQEALEKRYAGIVDKETKFEARMAELQAALDKRESVLESREQASLARVQEQKDAAVAAIHEHKRKWIEERQLLLSQSPAKPDTDSKAKQTDNKVSTKDEAGATSKAPPDAKDNHPSSRKEKDTVAKEKDGGDVKKTSKEDTSSKQNPKEGSSSKAKTTKEKPSSTPQKIGKPEEEKKRKLEPEEESDEEQDTDEQEEENGSEKKTENAEGSEDRPQAMEVGDEDVAKSSDDSDDSNDEKDEDDKEGSGKKEMSSEPSVKAWPKLTSLCESMDGPGLRSFLTAQEEDMNLIRKELPSALKCSSDPSQLVLKAIEGYYSSGSSSEGTQGKKLSNRRSCITLLESLAVVLADGEKVESDVLDKIKDEARMVADLWKSKLNPKGTDEMALLDAQSFLQLLATFGLAKEYDEDQLCDLVVPICTRERVPALLRKLGLAKKASDLVERLIKDGKELDAIAYIQEYRLSEKFPIRPLLKAYLKEIRQGHLGKISEDNKFEFHMNELNAARAVLNCVEKYKLEAEYRTKRLIKRIVQLERMCTHKKRSSDDAGGGSKKPRTNGPGAPPPFRSSDRVQFGGRGMGGRNYGAPYGQGRGGRGGYAYPAGGPGYGASSYPHGNYQYSGGSPYQGSYMR